MTNKIIINKWRLREACDVAGVSMTELAAGLECSVMTINRHLKTGFKPETVKAIRFRLGVSQEDLTDFLAAEKECEQCGGGGEVAAPHNQFDCDRVDCPECKGAGVVYITAKEKDGEECD